MIKTAVKERPILFRGDMVRAILEGRKTQTRRPVKPQPIYSEAVRNCPYGKPGDRLWVRETWNTGRAAYALNSGIILEEPKPEPWMKVIYRATSHYGDDQPPWRPSIHMPRWASRITLEITDVRVERIIDITSADCVVEGYPPTERGEEPAKSRFAKSWNATYPGSWDRNDWVWAIEFRRIV